MGERHLIRLYISGATPKSARAIQNVREICERKLAGRYELEVIDVYQQTPRACQDHVRVTPTLIEESRGTVRRLVGRLWDRKRVLAGLGLATR